MNHNYIKVIACVLLSFSGYSLTIAQSTDPEFIDCSSAPDTLCVEDEGVRLPSNNQLFLGEEDPEASSCSVHVTQKRRVRSHCGSTLQYEVLLFIHDTSSVYILKSVSTVTTDSLGEAELTFNTEEAVDSVIRTSGIPYGADCSTPHLIKWVVLDSCGGFSVCEQRIDLYDCSPPSASTPAFSYIIPVPIGCWLDLYASDFHTDGLDDCTTREELVFSFDSSLYQPNMVMHPCSIPAYGVELPWKIWIADGGKDENCDGQIDWSERNKFEHHFIIVFTDSNGGGCCDPNFETTVNGKITTIHSDEGISGVHVSLLRPGSVFPTYVTTSNGEYTFQLVLSGEVTTIEPEKNDRHKNGVSTLDLVRIQKHLLGRELFTTPFQYIAADANNSQNVSAIDLVELRKLILGIYSELPSNKSWRFVAKEYNFHDTMQPWSFSETISFTNMLPGNADFYAIKIGDVNGTAQPNIIKLLPRETLPPFEFITDQQSFQVGDVINVDFRMPSYRLVTGFQFTLAVEGMEILDVLSGKISLSDENYAILEDKMTMSWFDENDIEVSKGEVLFTLQLRANIAGTLSQSLAINSEITAAEIYLNGEQAFLPVLSIQNHEAHQLEILSCFPNPWKDQTTIQFYLHQSDFVAIALFDATGRRIQTTNEFLPNGYHQHQISSSDFSGSGKVFVEISTTDTKVFQKMIVVE